MATPALAPNAKWYPSPINHSTRNQTLGICIHNTYGSKDGDLATLTNGEVDSHFYITKTGELYQLLPLNSTSYTARATANKNSIHIEHEGKREVAWTNKQYEASVKLVAWLCNKYNVPVRHVDPPENWKGLYDHRDLQGFENNNHGDGVPPSFPGWRKYLRDIGKGSARENSTDTTNPSNEDGSTSSGYPALTDKMGIPSNEVIRQVPQPLDNLKTPSDEIKDFTPEKVYNSLDIDFKRSSTSRFLGTDAYFPGGKYDLTKNKCWFQYTKNGETKKLSLLVPPNGISWSYSLRTKIEDTYGGQVIQILGVQIDNFKINGYIPTGFWGKVFNKNGVNNNYFDNNYSSDQYYNDDPLKNGIVHVANFFRDFFAEKSQYSFTMENMEFHYPHYGWSNSGGKDNSIKIIPYDFPRVRLANDEILPEWQLECSVVEYLSSHFAGQVTKFGANQLQSVKAGIGFTEFIEWSDPSATSDISVSEQAKSLGASYATFVREFDPKESDALAKAGFSYPPEIIDKTITKKIETIIQDRFSENVS